MRRLTFELTCERRHDATGRGSKMPAAGCSGQARHAVATQVERGVRQHCARFQVMSEAIWRKGWHSTADYTSCWKPHRAASMLICQTWPKPAGRDHVFAFSESGAKPEYQTCQHSMAANTLLLWLAIRFLEVCPWLRRPKELHFERLRRSRGCFIHAARRTSSKHRSGAWLCCLTCELT
jgi:hypothetical protein